jgi:DNA polymerase
MGHLKFTDFLRIMGVSQSDLGNLTPKQIVEVYRSAYTNIKALWDIAQADWLSALLGITGQVSHKGCLEFIPEAIVLPSGLSIMYPNITGPINDAKYGLNLDKHTYGAKLVENVTQALARIILTDAELYLAERGARAVLSVHDELVFVVPTEKVGGFAKVLKAVLNRPVPWAPGLIVDSEITWGQTYGEQTEIK